MNLNLLETPTGESLPGSESTLQKAELRDGTLITSF